MDARQLVDQVAGSDIPDFIARSPSTADACRELIASLSDDSIYYPELALRAVIALSTEPDVSMAEVRDFLSGVRLELNILGLERLGVSISAGTPLSKSAKSQR